LRHSSCRRPEESHILRGEGQPEYIQGALAIAFRLEFR
jgi:hypothetical protein